MRGLRVQTSDSMMKRRYAQGDISFTPNVENVPFFLALALGSVSTGVLTDASYTHTFTVQNDNSIPRTASIIVQEGGVQTIRYTNCVLNSLTLEVSDDYATMTANVIGKFPATTTFAPSFSKQTEFAYHQLTVKFGTTLANATAAQATPLKGFTLAINNNVLLDEAFLSGSNGITNATLLPGRLSVTGTYTLHFVDTVELAKYQANTRNAMVVQFTGNLIGSTSTEDIAFRLGRVILSKPPVEYPIDNLIVLTQEFEVEWDTTDAEITATVRNTQANAAGVRYNPA